MSAIRGCFGSRIIYNRVKRVAVLLAFVVLGFTGFCGSVWAETSHGAADQSHSRQGGKPLMVHGHRISTTASIATKTENHPMVNIAQSVTVITRHEMDVRGVLSLSQAVRYVAGITQDQRGATATRYDMFALRGFSVPTYLDGLKLEASPTGYAAPQIDMFRVNRIEVLKGPSSALYGQSSPGGLLEMSSKLPTDARSYGSVAATGGSFDLYRVDADVGGWASDDGKVRYRVYGTANGSHSQLSQTGSRRFSISPAVTFGGGGPTTLTLLGNYQYDPTNASYGSVPLIGSLVPGPSGWVRRDFYDGDRAFEEYRRKQGSFTYILTHRFSHAWELVSRARYDDIKTDYENVYTTGKWLSPTTVQRATFGSDEHLRRVAMDTQLLGHVHTGPVNHTLMVGLDYDYTRATELARAGSAPALDVVHPVYNGAIPVPPLASDYNTRQQQIGVYAQDELRIGSFYLTGSLRNDWYTAHQQEYVANTSSSQHPSQISFRVAGLYHFNFGLAPYITYSTSFQPQAGIVSENGGRTTHQADPSVGRQLEGGVKYQIPGTSMLFSAAGFHIEQSNVLVSVGDAVYSTESGRVHSDGFEFEAHADVHRNLMVTAALSVQRVHDESTGKPLVQSGRGNASLFAFYTIPKGRLKGVGFGGGLRYEASAYGGSTASMKNIRIPSYVVFDASFRYDLAAAHAALRGWTLSASVRNLFDKRYIASCYGSAYSEWCWYGERRNAQATLSYSW